MAKGYARRAGVCKRRAPPKSEFGGRCGPYRNHSAGIGTARSDAETDVPRSGLARRRAHRSVPLAFDDTGNTRLTSTPIHVSITNMKSSGRPTRQAETRPYTLGARADAAAATHEAIGNAFVQFMRDRWFDEITLDEVARAAGVTVQTVIRRYGGKQGLLEAATDWLAHDIGTRRASPPGDTPAALDALIRDYEVIGDFLLRLLAQEERHPALKPLLDFGRAGHREWATVTFRHVLEGLAPAARKRRLALLVVATDVYTWKLLRRDQGFSPAVVKTLMTELTHQDSTARNVSNGGRK